MGTPMNTAEWARFVLPIVRKEWYQRIAALNSPIMDLYGIGTSVSSVEYSQGIGELGLVPEYNSADAEGAPGSIEYDSFNPLYEKTFTHKEYAKGIAIERKLWDDTSRQGLIPRRAAGLGNAFATTIATHMSSVLNNAFSDSYLGSDGEPLCETNHPNRATDTGTTFSNTGTTALSHDAVVAARAVGMALDDDRGNPFPVFYDTLIVPPALAATGQIIVGSAGRSGTGNNDINTNSGLRLVVDPYLTDANNWFMVDSTLAKQHLLWFWRVMPEINMDPASNFNLVARFSGYMRYSFGFDDWRWIYGSEV